MLKPSSCCAMLRELAAARAGGAGKASWVHQRGHGLQVKHGKTLTLSFFGRTISDSLIEDGGDPCSCVCSRL